MGLLSIGELSVYKDFAAFVFGLSIPLLMVSLLSITGLHFWKKKREKNKTLASFNADEVIQDAAPPFHSSLLPPTTQSEKSFSQYNPINYVDKWNTPIMIVQGGKDYRVPIEQGMQAFQAAQLKGIKSKLLYLPDENHWVLSAQNALVWQREFYKWLDETLKNPQPQTIDKDKKGF